MGEGDILSVNVDIPTKLQIEWRRNQVLRRHLRGLTQTETAKELQVAQSTVSEDLAKIYEENEEYEEQLVKGRRHAILGLKTIESELWQLYDGADRDTRIEILKNLGKNYLDLLGVVSNRYFLKTVIVRDTKTEEELRKELEPQRFTPPDEPEEPVSV